MNYNQYPNSGYGEGYFQQQQSQGGYQGSYMEGPEAASQNAGTVDQQGYAAYHGPQQQQVMGSAQGSYFTQQPQIVGSGPQFTSQSNLLNAPSPYMGSGPIGPGPIQQQPHFTQQQPHYQPNDSASFAQGFSPGPNPIAYSGIPTQYAGQPVQQYPDGSYPMEALPIEEGDAKELAADGAAGEWAGGYEEPDEKEQEFENKKLYKSVQINWFGLLVFTIYLFAFGFYIWARASYTLNVGRYNWYSNMFLVWEVFAALPIILHGWPLTRRPVSEWAKRFKDPTKKPPNPKNTYHVRFIVPSEYHSLSSVQATTQSLLSVTLPKNTTRTIYLADDLNEQEKKDWVDSLNENEVVYLSGRKKRYWEEINPKSALVNWVLRQLYPDSDRQGIISLKEVVMLVEPGKIVSSEILVKTLYLLDSGSDVGMLLTPACLADLPPGSDLFNAIRIPHWEFRQPGLDAMRFVDAEGAPYMVRARALQSVGWYPEEYYAEDYVLGLRMMKGPWQARLLQEYLVIQKGPQGVGHSFHQKKQQAVGQFQVLFSKDSPLNGGFTITHMLLGISKPLAMTVNFMTVPMFLLVPVVSLVWGVFPALLNQWFAIAVSAYYPAMILLKYYGTTLRHITVLWFEYVSYVLLWLTHLGSFLTVIIASCTSKRLMYIPLGVRSGNGPTTDSSRMPPVDYFLHIFTLGGILTLAAFAGMEIHDKRNDPSNIGVEVPFAISYAWLLFNVWPYFLVLIYGLLDKDWGLRACCLVARMFQLGAVIFSLVWLWTHLSHVIDNKKGLELAYDFYDAERSGEILDDTIPWRNTSMADAESENQVEASGGWYMDGFYGFWRHTVPIAYSVSLMSWGFDSYRGAHYDADIFGRAQQQTIFHGAKWLFNSSLSDAYNYASTVKGLVASAGNLTVQTDLQASWGRPEDIEVEPREFPVEVFDDAVQLSAAMAAGLAAAHKVYAGEDYQETANQFIIKAEKLFEKSITPFAPTSTFEQEGLTKKEKKKMLEKVVLDKGIFQSKTYFDDLLWASAWMFRATNKQIYLSQVETWFKRHTKEERPALEYDRFLFNWDDLYWGSIFVLASTPDVSDEFREIYKEQALIFLHQYVCAHLYTQNMPYIQKSPQGRVWHTNATQAATAVQVSYLALEFTRLNNDDEVLTQELRCFAFEQMRYVLGDRNGQSLLVGYGDKFPEEPAARAASCEMRPAPCGYDAYLSEEPNPQVINGALVHGPNGNEDIYLDRRSDFTSGIQLDWNAAVAPVFAAMQDLKVTEQYCRTRQWGLLKADLQICKMSGPIKKDDPTKNDE